MGLTLLHLRRVQDNPGSLNALLAVRAEAQVPRIIMPLRFSQNVIEDVRQVIHVRQMTHTQRGLDDPDR